MRRDVFTIRVGENIGECLEKLAGPLMEAMSLPSLNAVLVEIIRMKLLELREMLPQEDRIRLLLNPTPRTPRR